MNLDWRNEDACFSKNTFSFRLNFGSLVGWPQCSLMVRRRPFQFWIEHGISAPPKGDGWRGWATAFRCGPEWFGVPIRQ